MRDIRGDLRERAKLIEEEIGATQREFDERMKQLKLEHQGKLEDLKSDLRAVQIVITTEDRFLGSARPPAELQSQPMPPQHPEWQQAESRQPAAGAMMRKVG